MDAPISRPDRALYGITFPILAAANGSNQLALSELRLQSLSLAPAFRPRNKARNTPETDRLHRRGRPKVRSALTRQDLALGTRLFCALTNAGAPKSQVRAAMISSLNAPRAWPRIGAIGLRVGALALLFYGASFYTRDW